ncbi:hypothetical protein A2U01_0096857, partial [Trifolium medium]|nr:hypothetical protein [Trifolium medium]
LEQIMTLRIDQYAGEG